MSYFYGLMVEAVSTKAAPSTPEYPFSSEFSADFAGTLAGSPFSSEFSAEFAGTLATSPPAAALSVLARTPLPKASATASVGTAARIRAQTPTPRAAAAISIGEALSVAATTPLPKVSAGLAVAVEIAVGAVAPPPRAYVSMPEPATVAVLARTPSPRAAAQLGRAAVPPPTLSPPAAPIGTQADMLARLKLMLPRRWFPDTTPGAPSRSPVVDSVLSGAAATLSWLYSLLDYVKLQRRLATATDANLDLISADFFGLALRRHETEQDEPFRARIISRLLRERATRRGVIEAITSLTGHAPNVFEPANTGDTGGWGSLGMTAGTGLAYGLSGGWGSLSLPFQAFIVAYRPTGGGVAGVQGYGSLTGIQPPSIGGYGVGAIEYATASSVRFTVSDADIYATITDAAPAATIMWTAITDTIPTIALLDVNFILDVSTLSVADNAGAIRIMTDAGLQIVTDDGQPILVDA